MEELALIAGIGALLLALTGVVLIRLDRVRSRRKATDERGRPEER